MSDKSTNLCNGRLPAPGSDEWESVCDGCGRCCLQKLQDIDTGETHFTRIACHLLDLETCRCKDYSHRLQKVSDCTVISPLTEEKVQWLPSSCGYRTLNEGRQLKAWHPLKTADTQSVHDAGISVRNFAISEEFVHPEQYEEMIIEFDN